MFPMYLMGLLGIVIVLCVIAEFVLWLLEHYRSDRRP
jgi:hypothetical protein